jgi:cellulose synthase/poly-beta-1,6-N-acetylglucosamine synthase-like glycosyltransferase
MVTHNQALFADDAVQSVLAQTWTNWELIIVDQGSEDATRRLIEKYADSYPGKIRCILLEFCETPARGRNFAIEIAKGSLVVPLDGDDVLVNHALEHYVLEMCRDPFLEIVVGGFVLFGNLGKTDALKMPRRGGCKTFDESTMLEKNLIMNSCMFKKSVWRDAGRYSELPPAAEDWDLILSLMSHRRKNGQRMRVKCIDKIILRYRQTGFSRNIKSITSRGASTAAIRTLHANLFSTQKVLSAHDVLKNKSVLMEDTIRRLRVNHPDNGGLHPNIPVDDTTNGLNPRPKPAYAVWYFLVLLFSALTKWS